MTRGRLGRPHALTPPAVPARAPRAAIAPRRAPRQVRSIAMVEAILAASEALLRADGRLTTSKVARAAGVSVGSLYQYFPSKHALMAALIERHAARGGELQAATLPRVLGRGLEATVRGFVGTLVRAFREEGRLNGALLAAVPAVEREALVRRELDRCVALAEDALRPHARRIAPRTPADAAYVLTLAVNSVARDAAQERPELLREPRLEDDLTALCLGYLRG